MQVKTEMLPGCSKCGYVIYKKVDKMRYLIVCGGKIDKEFGLNEIKTDGIDAIIAADSGMDFLYENGVTPDIIVGDFDSATTKALEYFERKGQTEIHRLNPIKDDTDTEYAIRLAIREGARSIVMLGATGSRIDHVLGNISLLGIGLESGTDISIIDTNNRIRMADRQVTIEKSAQYGRFVSLIAVTDDNEVSLRGFKYPVTDYSFDRFTSLGISNEIIDDHAVIDIHRENLSLLSQKIDFLGIWDYSIFRIISENMYGHDVEFNEEKNITCSIGISYERNVTSESQITELIKKADDLMYTVKTGEKGHYAFF